MFNWKKVVGVNGIGNGYKMGWLINNCIDEKQKIMVQQIK